MSHMSHLDGFSPGGDLWFVYKLYLKENISYIFHIGKAFLQSQFYDG